MAAPSYGGPSPSGVSAVVRLNGKQNVTAASLNSNKTRFHVVFGAILD